MLLVCMFTDIIDKVSPVFCMSNFGGIKLLLLCKLWAAFCVIGSIVAVK